MRLFIHGFLLLALSCQYSPFALAHFNVFFPHVNGALISFRRMVCILSLPQQVTAKFSCSRVDEGTTKGNMNTTRTRGRSGRLQYETLGVVLLHGYYFLTWVYYLPVAFLGDSIFFMSYSRASMLVSNFIDFHDLTLSGSMFCKPSRPRGSKDHPKLLGLQGVAVQSERKLLSMKDH